MFDSIVHEVVEEIGVPSSSLVRTSVCLFPSCPWYMLCRFPAYNELIIYCIYCPWYMLIIWLCYSTSKLLSVYLAGSWMRGQLLFFFMKCNLSSKEIQELYSSAQDSFESTQLFTVPVVYKFKVLFDRDASTFGFCLLHLNVFIYLLVINCNQWRWMAIRGNVAYNPLLFVNTLDDQWISAFCLSFKCKFSWNFLVPDWSENMASKMPGCPEGGFTFYKMMVGPVKNVWWKVCSNLSVVAC